MEVWTTPICSASWLQKEAEIKKNTWLDKLYFPGQQKASQYLHRPNIGIKIQFFQ